MACDECPRLERALLESMVFADQAETALRGYFITHHHAASVSELEEYRSLKDQENRTIEERDHAYMNLVNHRRLH